MNSVSPGDRVVYKGAPAIVKEVGTDKWTGWVMIKRPNAPHCFRVKIERLSNA